MKRPTQAAGHRSTSGTKRKIEDRKTFEIVDNGPEALDSSVEEQRKSKRTRVHTVPADATRHSRKTYNLKRK
jgi:hypothetical protein